MFYFLRKLIGKQPSSSCANTTITDNGNGKASKYAVYIYYSNSNKNSGAQWRKVGATHSAKRAVKHAQLLHRKQQYPRIEVKKCSYSKNESRNLCKTIRIYNKKRSSSWEKYMRSLSVSS